MINMSEGIGMMIDLIKLDTEKNNHRTMNIDAVSTEDPTEKLIMRIRRFASIVEREYKGISLS